MTFKNSSLATICAYVAHLPLAALLLLPACTGDPCGDVTGHACLEIDVGTNVTLSPDTVDRAEITINATSGHVKTGPISFDVEGLPAIFSLQLTASNSTTASFPVDTIDVVTYSGTCLNATATLSPKATVGPTEHRVFSLLVTPATPCK